MIAVLIPVLGRPERAQLVIESLLEASEVGVRPVFLCTKGDKAQIAAARKTGASTIVCPFELSGGDYARKINYGVTLTTEPWIFQGADDVIFGEGWDLIALAEAERRKADVVGTNDLGNPLVKAGKHATHSLIRRSYIEERGTIDIPRLALHEGYWHCWVDNELVETAVHRGTFSSARRSLVEHRHHIWRKGSDDPTYRRGQEHYKDDASLFLTRRRLWSTAT